MIIIFISDFSLRGALRKPVIYRRVASSIKIIIIQFEEFGAFI